jgi:hypothetical protein
MAFIGRKPTNAPLVSSDLGIGIVGSTNIADGTIVNADINASAAIAGSKLSGSFGKVLQVVTATDSTGRSTSSASFVTASNTMSVSITPSSASNKIFVTVSGNLYQVTAPKYAIATIFRDATDLGAASNKGLTNVYANPNDTGAPLCMTILDSPNTTSAITYQVYILSGSGGTATINENNCKGVITAFEIAG